MIPAHIRPLADHLWQSTLFVMAVWLLTLALQRNRAAIRHALWVLASLKFLIPFSLLVNLGEQFAWRSHITTAPPAISQFANQIGQPFSLSSFPRLPKADVEPAPSNVLLNVAVGLWMVGVIASFTLWTVRWLRIRKMLGQSRPLDIALPIPAASFRGSLEPGVFGVFRPVLLLPEGIEGCLSPLEMQAVVDHELCHFRRRDNLTAAIHMVVEALFWFHPFVWWIESRLLEERERACDEEVLRLGTDPNVYAGSMLALCRFYLASALTCIAGITGVNLKRRIGEIMENRSAAELDSVRILMLIGTAVVTLGVPVMLGVIQAQPQTVAMRPQVVATGGKDAFEAVSIRPIEPGTAVGRGGVTPGTGGCSNPPEIDPFRIIFNATKVYTLIATAYGMGCGDAYQFRLLTGEPTWSRSEFFMIQATLPKDSGVGESTNRSLLETGGPLRRYPKVQIMLRNLLVDRFKLAMHQEKKELPAYELVVAKGGPKLRPAMDKESLDKIRTPAGAQDFRFTGITTEAMAEFLRQLLKRPVVDRTGLAGNYGVVLYFMGIDEPVPDSPFPPLLAALREQLGLKLQETKITTDAFVIDHVERPQPNR